MVPKAVGGVVAGLGAKEVGKLARDELDKAIPTINDGDKASASGFENRKPDEKDPEQNNNDANGNSSGGGRPRRA